MELYGECVVQSFYQCMNEQVHPYDPEYKVGNYVCKIATKKK